MIEHVSLRCSDSRASRTFYEQSLASLGYAVDAFYKAALAAGGKDNGPPGPREEYGYAAFVLDPDGHNIEAVIWDEELRKKKPRGARTSRRGRSSRRGRRKARRS